MAGMERQFYPYNDENGDRRNREPVKGSASASRGDVDTRARSVATVIPPIADTRPLDQRLCWSYALCVCKW